MSLPPSLAHTYKCGHTHKDTHTPSPALILFLKIVAGQKLEKVSAALLDFDSSIVIISYSPSLSFNVSVSVSLGLKQSFPYVGRRRTHTHTQVQIYTSLQIVQTNTHGHRVETLTHKPPLPPLLPGWVSAAIFS